MLCKRGGSISQEEAHLWRERYRVLFDRNVAGIVLTTPEGRIMDCNEQCAHILGFGSRNQMLTHSAWDLYFDRTDREALIRRLRTWGIWPAQEVCLRRRHGAPIWVLATGSVVSVAEGGPELFQGTLINITAQKTAQARLGDTKCTPSPATIPSRASPPMVDLSQKLAPLLQRVNTTLRPNNLSTIDRAEIQECVLALEQMKMLMAELEIRRLLDE